MASSYREFSDRARRRRRRQGFAYFCMFVLMVAMILGVAYLVVKVADILYPAEPPVQDFTPVDTLDEVLEVLEPQPPEAQGMDQAYSWEGPLQQEVDAAALTNPDYRMISLAENGRVDMSYFNDVTFVGDSLSQGIESVGATFPDSVVAAWKGCNPMSLLNNVMTQPDGSVVNAIDYIVSTVPGKVYILLGSNALTSQKDEIILKYYEQLLDTLGERLPGTLIYVQSIPTVTRSEELDRARRGQDFSRERINGLNDQLAKMVHIRGLYFVNLQEALCTDEGYLNEAYNGGDGLHLNKAGYEAWRDYLVSHTAHRWDNPYLLGSPYYDPAANDAWLNGEAIPTPPVEEAPVEETPVEETPVEETPVEEAPVEG